jgi:hypothetical protein
MKLQGKESIRCFMMMIVRMKADLPTSATRERTSGGDQSGECLLCVFWELHLLLTDYLGKVARKKLDLPSIVELGGDELPIFEDDDVSNESNEVEDDKEEQDHLLIEMAQDTAEYDNEHTHDCQDGEDVGEDTVEFKSN